MEHVTSRATAVIAAVSVLLLSTLWSSSAAPASPAPPLVGRGFFQLVGHSPLLGRGMNAALAIAGHYAYIGSRTDAQFTNMREIRAEWTKYGIHNARIALKGHAKHEVARHGAVDGDGGKVVWTGGGEGAFGGAANWGANGADENGFGHKGS